MIKEGQFSNGQLQGLGSAIFEDGTYHIGWWKYGQPFGYGVGTAFTGPDGEEKDGYYDYTQVSKESNFFIGIADEWKSHRRFEGNAKRF